MDNVFEQSLNQYNHILLFLPLWSKFIYKKHCYIKTTRLHESHCAYIFKNSNFKVRNYDFHLQDVQKDILPTMQLLLCPVTTGHLKTHPPMPIVTSTLDSHQQPHIESKLLTWGLLACIVPHLMCRYLLSLAASPDRG